MGLVTELKYNTNDFNGIDLNDLIVVFDGNVNIIHTNNITDTEYKKIYYLLQELCNRYRDMRPNIFDYKNDIRELYTKNNFSNIDSAILQFSGFPKIIIGTVEEVEDGWGLAIDNDYYDVLNSKELQQLLKTNILQNMFSSLVINGKEYKLNQLNNIKNKKIENIPLTNPLYHGTTEKFLYNILTKGLRKVQDNSLFSVKNDGYVFLTSDYNIANEYAEMYSRHYKTNQVILEIDSNLINKNNIVLDYDFLNMFGNDSEKNFYNGESIEDSSAHKGNIVSVKGNYGTKFNKIGYKGVIMPNAIKYIYINKNGNIIKKTRNEYLNEINMKNESKNHLNESYYCPEDLKEQGNYTVKLYHNTTFDGFDEILESGKLDTHAPHKGECKWNVIWFTRRPNMWGSRFKISIIVSSDDFKNGIFEWMNDGDAISNKDINVFDYNFRIETIGDYNIDNIVKKCNNISTTKDFNKLYEILEQKCNYLAGDRDYKYLQEFESLLALIARQYGKVNIFKEFFEYTWNGEDINQERWDELNGRLHIEENRINEVDSTDINLSSFKPKTELHPKLWVNNKLNSRVRLRLLDIADDFIDTLAVDWVKPKDIVFTGSLANYNWSRYSDIDIHVILDYNKVYKKKEFVEDYFSSKKELWLNEHPKLSIYGFPIELYVEDSNEQSTSSGIYSLNKNEWIKEPVDFEDVKLNAKYIKNYAAKLMTQIDNIEKKQKNAKDDYKVEQCRKELLKIFDRLKKLRREGLKKCGEMSSGNIIFKILRRTKYIDKIWELINTSYDKINSIKENKTR